MKLSCLPSDVAQALRKVMASGSQAALAALAQIIDGAELTMENSEYIEDAAALLTAPDALLLQVGISGGASGNWLWLMPQASARQLLASLTRSPWASWNALSESVLCELANILACAFWGEVARSRSATFIPGVPLCYPSGAPDAMLAVAGQRRDPVMMAVQCFMRGTQAEAPQRWQSHMILLLDRASALLLADAVNKTY